MYLDDVFNDSLAKTNVLIQKEKMSSKYSIESDSSSYDSNSSNSSNSDTIDYDTNSSDSDSIDSVDSDGDLDKLM